MNLLESLFALGEARPFRACASSVLRNRSRMHARQSRPETSASLLSRLASVLPAVAVGRSGFLGPLMSITADIAEAYVAIAQRDWHRALTLLEPAGVRAESLRRGRESIETKLLRALALRESGRDGEPLLAEALSVARSLGTRARRGGHASRSGRMGGADLARTRSSTGRAARFIEARSRTQRQRLCSLPRKPTFLDSSPAISPKNRSRSHSASADETVKWHLKNLFSKLSAGTREHLVVRARMLGLLGSG